MNMQEIKCPKCGEVFVVDESGYAQIVKQVRDREFEKELSQRERNIEEIKQSEWTGRFHRKRLSWQRGIK